MTSSIDSKVVPFGQAVDSLGEFLARDDVSEVELPGGPVPSLRKLVRDITEAASGKVDDEIGDFRLGTAAVLEAADETRGNAERAEVAALASENAQYDFMPANAVEREAISSATDGQRAFQRDTEHVWKRVGGAWSDQGLASTASKLDKSTWNTWFGVFRSAYWRRAILGARKRVLAGLQPDGKIYVWSARVGSAVIATLTATTASIKTLTIGARTFKPAYSATYRLFALASNGKTILGGLRKDGWWHLPWLTTQIAQLSSATVKALTVSRVTAGAIAAKTVRARQRFALTAAGGKVVLASVDQDGYWTGRARPTYRETAAVGTEYSVYTVRTGSSWSVIAQHLVTGALKTIYSGVYVELIGVVRSDVLMRTERGALKTASLDGGPSNKQLYPTPFINVGDGDSLTAGASDGSGGPYTYHGKLKTLMEARLGRSVECVNMGIGGQRSWQIAWRLNALPVYMTVDGGQVPEMTGAQTWAACTFEVRNGVSRIPFAEQGSPSYRVLINGVWCLLNRNGSNTAFRIGRVAPGAAVDVAPAFPVWLDTDVYMGRPGLLRARHSFWICHNDAQDPDAVLEACHAVAKRLEVVNAQYVFLTHVAPFLGDPIVDAATLATNNRIKADFPNNVLDVRAKLLTRGNGSAADNTNIAAGNVPASLRIDGIHLNQLGEDYVAQDIFDFYVSKGWL